MTTYDPDAESRAEGSAPSLSRRLLVVELVIVLAVSLGRSAVYSVVNLLEAATRPGGLSAQTTTMNRSYEPDRPWFDLTYQLLAITFAATDTKFINDAGNGWGLGSSIAIIDSALGSGSAKLVVLIATIGQLFCGMACLTSASRMCYAFSRDRAVPGHRLWTRLNHHRMPAFAVLFITTKLVML